MIEHIGDYKQVFVNEVYAKDVQVPVYSKDVQEVQQMQSEAAKSVVMPARYTEPTLNRVMQYIQQKCREAGNISLVLPTSALEGKSSLERMIASLAQQSQQVISHIIKGEGAEAEYLLSNILAPDIKEDGLKQRNQYVIVRYGTIPLDIISDNERLGKIKDARWYDAALSSMDLMAAGFGEKFSIGILLKEDGTLINKKLVFNALEIEARESKVFQLYLLSRAYPSYVEYPAEILKEEIEKIYISFNTAESLKELKDVSDFNKESLASLAVGALIREMNAQAIIMQQLRQQHGALQTPSARTRILTR